MFNPEGDAGFRQADDLIDRVMNYLPALPPNKQARFFREITRLRKAVQAQAERIAREEAHHCAVEERFSLAGKAASFIITDWDLLANRVYRSPGIQEVLGYAPEEAPANSRWWFQQIHPDDVKAVRKLFSAAAGSPSETYACEYRMRHKAGHWVNIMDMGSILRDEHGKPVRVVGVSRDITQKHQLEQQMLSYNRQLEEANVVLKRSEQGFKNLLDFAEEAIWAVDAQGKTTFINPYGAKMLGYTVADMLGRRFLECFFPEDARLAELEMKHGKKVRHKEYRLRHRDGSIVWVLGTSTPLQDEGGSYLGSLSMAIDISELKRVEEETRLNAVERELHHLLLEHREMERQQIARRLHDAPLMGLSGLIFTIQYAKDLSKDPELNRVLDQIAFEARKQIDDLREICNDLRPPALLKFGLARAIQSHVEDFRYLHPQIKMDLNITGDDSRLQQPARLALYRIYQDSLNNAIEHSNTSLVNVSFETEAETAVLTIRDDGVGFEVPDDWVELARKDCFGLVGMKERAQAIGGDLSISARPGEGTTIQVKVKLI